MTSWFARLFPGLALKREIRLRQLELLGSGKRSIEAISGSRTRKDFLTTSESPDAAIAGSIDTLRKHVRQLEYNNGYVSGPIRRIANNTVGHGIRFQSRLRSDDKGIVPKINQTMADRFNAEMERSFKFWAKKADLRLMFDFYELQHQVEMALLRDNEVLVIGRNSKRRDRLIPYCLEVLEADRLSTPMGEIHNPKIRHGIEYDDEGVPAYYFVLKVHPGETLSTARKRDEYEQVPAYNPNGTKKVLHLFNPMRPEQTRGLSFWSSGLKDMQDLDRYMEAEKLAALEAACLTGAIKTEAPQEWQGNYTNASDSDDYDRIHEFAPGMMHYLRPGESLEVFNPARPNSAFGDYVAQLLRGVASALDIPPELLTQDWHGMNYSNARTVLLQFYLPCRIRQAYLSFHLNEPVYQNVMNALVAKGRIQAPNFFARLDDYLYASGWIPPGWQWVDPVKEAQGKQIEVDNDFDTLASIAASKGVDWEENIEQRARELQFKQRMEEKYDIKFPAKGSGGSPTEQEPEEGDEDEDESESKSKSILSVIRN